jgi:hypothetical protein
MLLQLLSKSKQPLLNPLENRLRQQTLVLVLVDPNEVKNKRRIPIKRRLDKIPGFHAEIWWRFSS